MRSRLFVAYLLLAGCSLIDAEKRVGQSKFTPGADRASFVFEGEVLAPPKNDSGRRAEAPLRQWITEWLFENNMCSNGYNIISDERVPSDVGDDSYRLIIKGKCA